MRDFWRGEAPTTALTPRLCASAEQFNHSGRRASACVNSITAHDGFTLNDIVTYNEKHNEANGEDSEDGSSDNRSWNCGVEGPTNDAGINQLRERQIPNMLATLILSQGTPMLLAGDEFGRTQDGNNNAYCQDREISWLDWEIKPKGSIAHRLHPEIDRTAPQISGPASRPLPHRRVQRRSWGEGRYLDQCQRIGDASRRLGRRFHEVLRHADGRPGSGDWHSQTGTGCYAVVAH